MKKSLLVLPAAFLVLFPSAYCKDHSNSYQMGTYVTSSAVAHGTISDDFDCDPQSQGSAACSGRSDANGVRTYRIDVADGFWVLEARDKSQDSDLSRNFGEDPISVKAGKRNPLDLLKNGDKILFRVETHRKLNAIETDVEIPFADNPNKEARFIGTFNPTVVAGQSKDRSNVRAMCDAHKLSPQLEKQFCALR